MSRRQTMNKKQGNMFLIIAVLIFLVVILITGIFSFRYATSHRNDTDAAVPEAEEMKEDLLSLLSSGNVTVKKTDLPETKETETPDFMPEKKNDPAEENMEPITEQAVALKDIYSEKGETVRFKCYDQEADAYMWEYYDMAAREWLDAEKSLVFSCPDELGRMVSMFEMTAEESKNRLMIRCTLHFPDREAETQTASLHIIDEINAIVIEDMETDANRYLGVDELPVTVSCQDGTEETIAGLNGLHFINTEENTDHGMSVSGNRIETTTIVKTECEYLNTGFSSKEIPVRYRKGEAEPLEAVCSITGKDSKPPEISEVTVSPFEISSIDQPVNLTITITARDDVTPDPELEYAFLHQDQELAEGDWIKKPSFDASIERNGVYYAYVRDRSGNIGKLERELITVDTKAPVITDVSLSDKEGWCRYNTIMVTARDAGAISYCYENESAGIYSGWIANNDYTADANGIWFIKARDAVGNISETEITISNIDQEAPVIQRIRVK